MQFIKLSMLIVKVTVELVWFVLLVMVIERFVGVRSAKVTLQNDPAGEHWFVPFPITCVQVLLRHSKWNVVFVGHTDPAGEHSFVPFPGVSVQVLETHFRYVLFPQYDPIGEQLFGPWPVTRRQASETHSKCVHCSSLEQVLSPFP